MIVILICDQCPWMLDIVVFNCQSKLVITAVNTIVTVLALQVCNAAMPEGKRFINCGYLLNMHNNAAA